jgi:CBS domain-containing protein/anti-sigma regulatory factor (Ser/Thr protein kinase)
MKRLKQIQKVQELVYELRVKDAAVTDVLTLSPDVMMSKVRSILRSRRITAAPVIKNGELLGIVSVEDYINWLTERANDLPVRERMSRDLITIYADEPMIDAIKYFEKYRHYEFPVIERETGNLLGIITKFDVIVALLKSLDIDYYKKEISEYKKTHFFNDMLADETLLSFIYHVPGSDIKRGGEASSMLKRNLGYLGIHPDTIRRVAVATYEAEMNLIIYGQGGDIKATLDNTTIFIEVADKGPGIADVDQALKPGYSTASDWVRELGFGAGMGFPNIQKCAEKFEISSKVGEGTVLKISIPLEQNVK